MNRIFIRATFKTPHINFNHEKGLLEIKGKSIPEHAHSFYGHLVEWIKVYSENPSAATTVNIELEYTNTDTKKYLLEMLELFSQIHHNNKKIVVNWYYENADEGMMEAGQEYSSIVNMPFNYIGVEEFSPPD
ncbi:MAG TPA: DUF1987 domain-containing protein [Candidatus Babeliales bacterium]|nr:DUF1987 domain-containing protein [Candidatus Babeliales bacterium]